MSELVSFSIIIPTYNRANLVLKTILSLLTQTHLNFEIIVVDDGSTDNTAAVIASIHDKRVKYFSKPNAERGAARNYGVSKASGNYINYFDSDDLAYSNHLQTAVDVIRKNNFPEMLHLGYDYKTEEGKLLEEVNQFDGNVIKYVVQKKMISMMSMFIRKDIAEQFPFSEDRDFTMGEDALHLCQLVARYTFFYDNAITSSVINHPQRTMKSSNEASYLYCRKQLIAELGKDDAFMKAYGIYLPQISNEYNYLLWKNALENRENKKAWQYYRLYIKEDNKNIFSRRTLVFFRNYIYNLFS